MSQFPFPQASDNRPLAVMEDHAPRHPLRVLVIVLVIGAMCGCMGACAFGQVWKTAGEHVAQTETAEAQNWQWGQ